MSRTGHATALSSLPLHADEGVNTVQAVRIAGRTYPKAITFNGGRYFHVRGACTTFRTSVGTPDNAANGLGDFAFVTFTRADLSDEPKVIDLAPVKGAAPLAFQRSVSGKQVIAFGGGDMAAVAPQARCSVNRLPSFELPE